MNGENGKIVEMIDELEGKIYQATSSIIYCANPVLNAILTERVIKSKEQDVEIAIFVEPYLKVGFIQISDMVSMFGNLLDNAVEAASKCEPGKREVKVRLFKASEYLLMLYIENSFAESAKREGNRFLTTKEDKNSHGLGIGICEMLASKYGGLLELKEENGMFVSILTLSITSSDED